MNKSDHSGTNANNEIIVAAISYLAIVGWLVAMILNRPANEFSSFHIRQSLGVHLAFIASGILMGIPILGWVAGGLLFLVTGLSWLLGLLYAIQGKDRLLPIGGKYFQEWFQSL